MGEERSLTDAAEDAGPRADLDALLRLQEVETTIRRLERRLSELPEQAELDVVLDEANRLKARVDANRVDMDLLDSEIRRAEGEIDLLSQRKDAEQARMYGGDIKSPKELQAIRAEISGVEGRMGEIEGAALEKMEQREELSATVEEIDARREELSGDIERLTDRRDEAAKEILAELAESRVARDRERQQVPDDVLERYERAKERHGGVGVGALDGGICTACRLELTPLERNDARADGPLTTCPQCQRLLVVLD